MTDLANIRETYDQEGYVIVRGAVEPELAAEAHDHVQWLLKQNPDIRPEQLHHRLLAQDPFMWRLAGDERMLDIAQHFIGPNIALFAAHYIAKPPQDGQEVLWHQDGAYWPLKPMDVVTLWLAATDSTPENGCMRILPRTQHTEFMQLHEQKDGKNVLGSGIDLSQVDLTDAVDIVLQPGDVSIHHPNILHGSNANISDRWRSGLTLRYIPTTTRIMMSKAQPFLLRGQAVEGINHYLTPPKFVEGAHMPFRGWEQWR